jgi:hypothetical protein
MYTCPICLNEIDGNKAAFPVINYNSPFSFKVACRCNHYYHKECLANQLFFATNHRAQCPTCRTNFTNVGERYKFTLSTIRYFNRMGIRLERLGMRNPSCFNLSCCFLIIIIGIAYFFLMIIATLFGEHPSNDSGDKNF